MRFASINTCWPEEVLLDAIKADHVKGNVQVYLEDDESKQGLKPLEKPIRSFLLDEVNKGSSDE